MEEVYYQDEYLTLCYNRRTQTARAVWNGFLSGEILRNAVLQCVRLLEEEHPLNWLADNRKMRAIRQKDKEWIETYIIPKLIASSLQKMATLVSEDIFNQMAVESIYQQMSPVINFETKFFKDEAAAYYWFKTGHTIPSVSLT